jgi:hypothetical protein
MNKNNFHQFVILMYQKVEQLPLAEQIRLYKMIGEKVKPKKRKRNSKLPYDITHEKAIEFIKKMCFSREVGWY